MIRFNKLTLLAVVGTLALGVPAVSAHTNVWNGDSGNNNKDGHEHRDEMYGHAGHDVLGGHAGDDYMEGNPGNDDVKGMSNADDVVTWTDGGGDTARGGDGTDRCFVDSADATNFCEWTFVL